MYHYDIGIGSAIPPLEDVEIMVVDCVYLACSQPCAASGRRLGHTGAATSGSASNATAATNCAPVSTGRRLAHGSPRLASAPPTWLPDPTAPNTDFCDLTTMISPLGSRKVVGLMWYNGIWLICSIVPKSYAPIVAAKQAGLSGLILIIPCCATAPETALGMVPQFNGGNPVPDMPFLITSDIPMDMLPSWTRRSRDKFNLLEAIKLVIACNPAAVGSNMSLLPSECAGNYQYMFATLRADLDGVNLNSPGAIFLYILVGMLFVGQTLYSLYFWLTLRKRMKVFQQCILLVEGVLCGGLRAFRQFAFPTCAFITGNVSFDSAWFRDAGGSLESSLSVGATFMTVTVYVKLLLSGCGIHLSDKVAKLSDIVFGFVSFSLVGVLTFLSILYPFQPWIKNDLQFLNGLGNDGLKRVTYLPGFILNTVFTGAFVILSVLSLYQMFVVARKGSSNSVIAVIKKIFKYVLMQIFGLALAVTATGLRSNFTVDRYYSLPGYGMYWIQLQFQSWGNLIAGWGVVLMIVSTTASSSTSSSSSSSSSSSASSSSF